MLVSEVELSQFFSQQGTDSISELWDEFEEVDWLVTFWVDIVHDVVKGTLEGSSHLLSDVSWDSLNFSDGSCELLGEEFLEVTNNLVLGLYWHTELLEQDWELVEVWSSLGSQFFLDRCNNRVDLFFR